MKYKLLGALFALTLAIGSVFVAVSADSLVTLSGHIYDEQGNPVHNELVSAVIPGQNPSGSGSTDSNGAYSFQVPAGTYNITITNTNSDMSQDIPYKSFIETSNYDISQDEVLDISLPAKQVTVHVQDENSNPIAGATITTDNSGFNNINLGTITSDDGTDGYFLGTGPVTDASGNATLWLYPTSYNITATPPSGSTYQATTNNVTVSSDGVQTITLHASVNLSGYIYDEQGNPVHGEAVSAVIPGENPSGSSTTDQAGHYAFQVAPGTYGLVITNTNSDMSQDIPYKSFIETSNYSLMQNTQLNFNLPARQVTVHVQNSSGAPVTGALVTTDNNGFDNIPLGTITSDDGYNGYFLGAGPTTNASGDATLWLYQDTYPYTIHVAPPSGSDYTTTSVNDTVSNDSTVTVTLQNNSTPPAFTSSGTATINARAVADLTITTTGTPVATITESGTLPTGITFHDNGDGTATLSGQASPINNGIYILTLTATNSAGTTNQTFALSVNNAQTAPTFVSSNNITASYNVPFSFTVDTTGNPIPNITRVSGSGTLPNGVKFKDNNDGTATISGTIKGNPTTGSSTFTLQAKNKNGTAQQQFTINW